MQLKLFLTSAAAAALLANASLAQTATDPVTGLEAPSAPEIATIEPRFTSKAEMTVGDVIGMVAYDTEGSRIAEIDYVLMQADTLSAVLGIGGFLGLGEYTVALPFDSFDLRPDGLGFTLTTDKEALKQLPEFDESGAESLPAETPIAALIGDAGQTEKPEAANPASEGTAPAVDAGAGMSGGEANCTDAQGNAMAECPASEGSAMETQSN